MGRPAFLIGSCRYQGILPHCFPPRLHCPAEVSWFLQNYDRVVAGGLTSSETGHSSGRFGELNERFVWGDSLHPMVVGGYEAFLKRYPSLADAFAGVDVLVVEVCTAKIARHSTLKAVPYNAYYAQHHETEQLTDDELRACLGAITRAALQLGCKKVAWIPMWTYGLEGHPLEVRQRLLDVLRDFVFHTPSSILIDVDNAMASVGGDLFLDATHFSERGEAVLLPLILGQLEVGQLVRTCRLSSR